MRAHWADARLETKVDILGQRLDAKIDALGGRLDTILLGLLCVGGGLIASLVTAVVALIVT